MPELAKHSFINRPKTRFLIMIVETVESIWIKKKKTKQEKMKMNF